MATAGPRYPGTTGSEVGPSGDNDWISTSPITADDATYASITAATYDAGDHSYRLKATNFGFDADIPAGSTINGITVEIEQRRAAGAAQDQEVRLYDSTGTLVGTDKQTATAWPATDTIATYGGAADTWAAGLDAADIRSAGFGVALIVLADAANTDIHVDFIRVTITYTAPPTEATGAITVPAATVAGTGSHVANPSATGSVTLPAATVAGTGALVLTGTGAVSVPSATVAGTGAEVFTATGAITSAAATVAGSGAEVFTATGAVTVPAATVAGTGDHTGGAPEHSGTGAISVPSATVSGAGSLVFTGTGAVSVSPPAVSGTGAEVITGTGAIVVPSVLAVGSGALVLVGTGAISVPTALIVGSGIGGPDDPVDDTLIAHISRTFRLRAIAEAEEAEHKKKRRKKKRRPTRAEITALL